ncbi:alpha/beta fold hydrolase [Pseudovibrio sp. Tun.PSC04-5.I4]|uniref:alpha/beta hydrolase n=1 Tax=Pseudovibrio sp. Tun.PSC04-5.I4 TaxID=1798213 RepID=UPI00088B653B|nr:alpha/beta fold hydrolase [Pseudovibrio sp. Tun.PSC04-5.I4]SDR49331.1 Dienelactone hydrolase [Pseudovibrio sp. Tun.PSC04-5.I4]
MGSSKRSGWFGLFIGLAILMGASSAHSSQYNIGPIIGPLGVLNMQMWRVPVKLEDDSRTITLDVTSFRPVGDGPFPLVIVNHGASQKAPANGPYDFRPDSAIRWFLEKGYAVAVLIRRGYGRSEGKRSTIKGCDPKKAKIAYDENAHDILSTISFFQRQDFVLSNRVVLVGFSAGGNSVLAAASKRPVGMEAVIAFAPGAKTVTPSKLICNKSIIGGLYRAYGSKNELPILWVYSQNDQFYSPRLARFFFESYSSENKSKQELVILPSDRKNGHNLFLREEGPEIWGASIEAFLEQ